MNGHSVWLCVILGLCVGLIIISTGVLRLDPFISLLVVTVIYGLAAGLPVELVMSSVAEGFGTTLGKIGIIVVFGSIMGVFLDRSGGAVCIARGCLRAPPASLPFALAMLGYVISIPVFCDSAFILLHPLLVQVAPLSVFPMTMLVFSLACGLTATHCLVPPTPGPVAAAAALGADVGQVMLLGGLTAVVAVSAGMVYLLLLWHCMPSRRADKTPTPAAALIPHSPSSAATTTFAAGHVTSPQQRARTTRPPALAIPDAHDAPSLSSLSSSTSLLSDSAVFPASLLLRAGAVILVPVALIALGSACAHLPRSFALDVIYLIGHPVVALFVGIILAVGLPLPDPSSRTGTIAKISKRQRAQMSRRYDGNDAPRASSLSGSILEPQSPSYQRDLEHAAAASELRLQPEGWRKGVKRRNSLLVMGFHAAAPVLLVTGAGGAFGNMLSVAGLGEVIGTSLASAKLGLVLPFLLSATIRVAQGSGTVAIVTAAALVEPLVEDLGLVGHEALVVCSVGAGGMFLSHVNDSFFWVISTMCDFPVSQMLMFHSAMTSIMGLAALAAVLAAKEAVVTLYISAAGCVILLVLLGVCLSRTLRVPEASWASLMLDSNDNAGANARTDSFFASQVAKFKLRGNSGAAGLADQFSPLTPTETYGSDESRERFREERDEYSAE